MKSVVCKLIRYEPLRKTMETRGITKYTLISKPDFSAYTIMTLKRNRRITINTLERLCKVLDCTPNDVVTFVEK